MPIGLVLADDHPLILNGLENLFRLEEEFQVLARCSDGLQALKAVREHRPDILVLDIRMPGKDGLEVAREIHAENFPTKVVILAAEVDENQAMEAARVGVQGIVLKEMAPKLLVQCLRKVYAGERWIEHRSDRLVLEKLLRREAAAREVAAILTPREIDIVRMVSKGIHNRDIAQKLFISEGTVKIHLHNVYEKLGVEGRLALLRLAQEKGLV